MNEKISIIIPAYNIERELPATLDNVLAQPYEKLEIIVVDDGSGDGTAAVIDDYAARFPNIRAIHKENGGVTSARLRGVEEATGDWIGFVDGDDLIAPEMYQRLIKNALEYDADISHCGYQMVFPNGRVDYYYNTGRLVEQTHAESLRDLLEGAFVEPSLWNKLFRKTLFVELQAKMDLSIKINEDVLMNYYLFKAAQRAVYEDFCPYHYVLRKGSAATSRLNEHKLLDPIQVTKVILEDVSPELQCVVLARLTRQLITLATMPVDEQSELILPNRREARKELRSRMGGLLRAQISTKLKIMALWTAIWPASYGWVHHIHARATGNDRKYDLD